MSNLYEEHKKLVARVQELEDTIFKMKKYYEDILQNLTDDNFSASFVSEKRGMKSQISMTAEAIKTMVTNANFKSKIEQTASQIRSEVASVEGDLSSSIMQTAKEITQKVTDSEKRLSTQITATANGITALTERVSDNEEDIGKFKLTADGLSTSIKKIFTDVAVLDEDWDTSDKDESKIYQVRGGNYYYHNGNDWVEVDSPTILSLFQQTSDGFKLIGNFSTTAQSGMNVDISGTRIDVYSNNSSGTPKLSLGTAGGNREYPVIVMGAGASENSIEVCGFKIIEGQGYICKDETQFNIVHYDGIDNNGKNVYTGIYITPRSGVYGDKSSINLKADKLYLNGEPIVAVFG